VIRVCGLGLLIFNLVHPLLSPSVEGTYEMESRKSANSHEGCNGCRIALTVAIKDYEDAQGNRDRKENQ
jgi:hypothetical protein